jgi:hypothetical protein
MFDTTELILQPVPIAALRPTQITVGMREVRAKRNCWQKAAGERRAEFLGRHLIPVIRGPQNLNYLIDSHYIALALHEEGVDSVLTTVVRDLSKLELDTFWAFLDNRGWTRPFDEQGRRREYKEIPKSVNGLIDDPFRSLACELVRGLPLDAMLASEFLWADYLRRRIERKLVEDDFDRALEDARIFAKAEEANYLPGWCRNCAVNLPGTAP